MKPENPLPDNWQHNDLVDTEFLYQNSPCGYLSFYPDGRIIKINETLVSWLQNTRDNIVKNNFSDLLSKGGKFYYQMVVAPLLTMQGFVNEINFDICSGTRTFPCLFNASTVKDKQGEIVAINAIILNITDRKKYEGLLLVARQNAEEERKKFEFLSNTIPNIIWTAAADGKVNFVNDRFFESFGSSSASLKHHSFVHLIHPEERRQTLQLWKKSLHNKCNLEIEARLKTIGGEYAWFLVRAVPYEDKDGQVGSWFGSCTNINDQKEKERKTVEWLNGNLSRADELITKNSTTLREIAFEQSHLVRQPLTNIMGIIHVMIDLEMDDQLKRWVMLLQESSTKLDEVIRTIVDKATLDHTVTPQDVDAPLAVTRFSQLPRRSKV